MQKKYLRLNKMDNETKSIYVVKVSDYVGGLEYLPVIQDVIRMLIISVVHQFMMSMKYPETFSIMSEDFLEYIIYIILGIMIYWLIFRKVVKLI